jgi:nicotinate-nucleotide pyrophosphorylase
VIVREEAVLCGAPWFEGVMNCMGGPGIRIDWQHAEGDLMQADSHGLHHRRAGPGAADGRAQPR